MLQQLRAKKKAAQDRGEGFTIIEVMIVLVIAAVIILIVFLAVPALQRNSRNNQRKNDAAKANAAVTEFANNNNGDLPDVGELNDLLGNSLSFYKDSGTGKANVTAFAPSKTTTGITDGAILGLTTTASCNATGGATTTGATARQFVILFAVETGGTKTQSQCLEG